MIALGGGARRLSERVREALARPRRRLVRRRARTTAWERVARNDGARWPRDRDEFEALLRRARCRSTRRSRDAVLPAGGASVAAARAVARRAARPARRARLAWARVAVGRLPGGRRGAGRSSCSAREAAAALGVERWFASPTARRWPSRASCCPPREAMIEVEAGEERKTLAEAERVLRELAPRRVRGATTACSRFGGGVVGDLAGLLRRHLPARRRRWSRCRRRSSRQVDSAYGGKTGVDLPEAKNYVGAYHHARRGARRPVDARDAARRGAGGGLRRGAEDGADRRRRALGAGAGARRARPAAASDGRDLRLRADQARGRRRRRARLRAGARCSTSATPSATRSRRRPATRATATARRSGSACSRRCGSRAPTSCATRSRELLERHGLPTRLDPAVATDDVLPAIARDKKRTARRRRLRAARAPGRAAVVGRARRRRIGSASAVEELRRT